MRILLVSPPSKAWNSRKHIHMGLAYLAGSLLAQGYSVDIWDAAADEPYESLEERLARAHYDVVAISAPTPLVSSAWQTAKIAKERGAITILGGPHPTLMPQESMERDGIDLVVRGEAERAIIEIMRFLERDRGIDRGKGKPHLFSQENVGHVAGLSWRDEQGRVKHNDDRILENDLDAIPFPAHHLFEMERYTNLNPLTDGLDPRSRAYTIVTSRGCPYQCIFCSKPITGNTWRARSVENVIAEWRWLVKDLCATEVGITDDVWNLDLERAKAICRALIENRLNHIPWVTVHGMRANNTDPGLFQLMKAAGCKRVGFGIESGDDEVLREIIKKGQTVEMARNAIKWAKAAKLETMGFFIYGLPGENEKSMEKTTRLALELDPDLAHFLMATPFPGTEMWNILVESGQIVPGHWDRLSIQRDKALFSHGDLTAETIEQKWRQAHRRFYLRPRRIARIMGRRDTWLRFPYICKTALRMLWGR